MNLNFAEKLGVFLGATTLSFALGIAACSPLAPSIEKNKLISRGNRPGIADPGAGGTSPNPSGLHLLFFRDHGGANLVVGQDGFTWFFKSRPTNTREVVISGDSLPSTLNDFKQGVDVDIPVIPASDWQAGPDGSFSASISFQLSLADNSPTPAQIESFDFDLLPPSPSDVTNALANHTSVNWKLRIKPAVSQDTKTAFLGAVDAIRLSIATSGD